MEPSRPNSAPPSTGGSRRRVLIVDDDESCCLALERLFEHLGQEACAFETFETARKWLLTSTPDIAIVDVRLGSYNGLQLVHLVRQANPAAVLVAMSGFDDNVLRTEASRVGASYLIKPLNLPVLMGILGLQSPPAGNSAAGPTQPPEGG